MTVALPFGQAVAAIPFVRYPPSTASETMKAVSDDSDLESGPLFSGGELLPDHVVKEAFRVRHRKDVGEFGLGIRHDGLEFDLAVVDVSVGHLIVQVFGAPKPRSHPFTKSKTVAHGKALGEER